MPPSSPETDFALGAQLRRALIPLWRVLAQRGVGGTSVFLLFILLSGGAKAQNGFWNTNNNGSWTNPAVWLTNGIAGATNSSNSTGIATFTNSLTAVRTVTVNTNRNIGRITFGSTNNGFTLSGGSLILSSNGVIQTLAAAGGTNTISSPVFLVGNGTFTANGSASSLLSIGAVTNSTAGSVTITLNGTNTGSNSVTGIIGNSTNVGTLALVKDGAGTWRLSGASTFSGGTTLVNGTINMGASQALGGGSLTLGSASTTNSITINLNGFNQTITGLSVGALNNSVVIQNQTNTGSGVGTLTINLASGTNSSTTNFFFRNGAAGALALVKNGSGLLDFSSYSTNSGSMSYSGGLTVNAGGFGFINTNTGGNSLGLGSITLGGGTLRYMSNGGSVTVSNTTTLTAATTSTIDTTNGTVTYSGAIGGLGALTKQGIGTLTLSRSNTFNGGITITAGTLIAGATNALSSNAVTVNDGSTLSITNFNQANVGAVSLGSGTITGTTGVLTGTSYSATNSGAAAISSILGGSGDLTKAGTGTLTLSAANTYSGGTILNQGGLSIRNSAAFGTGLVTVASNSTITALTNLTVANNYAINSGATATLSTVNNWTNSGSIRGPGSLTKTGTGTLTLSASNSYTGETIVSQGQLTIGNRFALSLSTFAGGAGSLSFGTLPRATFGGLASANGLALTSSDGDGVELTIGVNNADTTQSGSISGAGSLIKTGLGNLTLSGSNSYTGGTTLNQGGLSISDNAAFGTGSVYVASNSTITALTNLTVTNDYFLEFQTTATFSTASNWTNSGSISGLGSLTKAGSGTIILTGPNPYSGGTTLNQGGLSIGNSAALGTGLVTVASNSTITALTNLTVANNYIINSGATATFSTINNWTNSGSISGNGALTKIGTGTLILTGVSTYGGGTTLNQGGLSISNNAALGTGLVTVASNSTITALANLTVTNNYIINSGATATFSTVNNWTNSGSISGPGLLTKAGTGALILSGANSYTGTTTVSAGILMASSPNSLGASSSPITVSGTGTLNLGGNSFTRTGLITFSGGTLINGTLINNTANFSGQSGTVAATLAGSFGLTKTTAGILYLIGTNTYTGLTTISTGVLSIANSNTIAGWGNNNYAVASGAALVFGGGFTDDEITKAVYNSGKFSNAASFGFDTASGTNRIYSLVISNTTNGAGILGLAKVGAGTVTLTGSNSYSGLTTIHAGTLLIGNNNALGTGILIVNGGAIRSDTGNERTIPNNFSFRGNASLGSTNTDNNGELIFIGGGDFGNSTNNRTITVNSSVTMSGILTNAPGVSPAFIKAGVGTLTLSGNNSYSGETILNQGGLSISNNSAFGTGLVTVAADSTITALANLTVTNNYVINSNTTVTFSTVNNWTISGSINGDGGLNKTGSGTLTLSSDANDYTGGTTVSDGTLIVTDANSLGVSDSPITVTNTGTLDLGGKIFIRTGLITFAGGSVTNGIIRNNTATNFDGQSGTVVARLDGRAGLTKSSAGTLTLAGTNTYSGGTLVTDGTLMASNSTQVFGTNGVTNNGGVIDLGGQTFTTTFALGSGTIANGTISNNANFTLLENGTVAASLSGSGTLIKDGSGTLTLMESNSYSGGTLVTGGSIVAANPNALSINSVSVQGNGLLDLGSNTFANTFAITGGTITNGTISNNVNFTRFSNGTIGAALAGSGTLIMQGAGTLTLAASNSYTGGTVITNGTLTAGNDFALGATNNNLDIPSGTLSNSGYSLNVGALTIGNGTITGSGTITAISYTATNSSNALIANSLAGNAGLIKEDRNGTLTLSGSNTYSGGTTIRTGTINANNNYALGTGGLTITNGGTELALTNSSTILRLGNGINISNGVVITLGSLSRITNTGTITISGGDNIINLTTNWSWSIPAGTSVTYPLLQGTNVVIRTNNDTIFLNIPSMGVSLNYGTTTNVGRVGVVGGTNFTFTNSVYRTNRTSIPTGLVLTVDVPGMPIEAFPASDNAYIPAAAFDGGVKAISVSPNEVSSALNGNGRVVVWIGSYSVTNNIPSELSSGVTAISAGYSHMMALKNGRVTTWGSISDATTPARARSGVVAISAGTGCLAIRQDGAVVGWGGKYTAAVNRTIGYITNAIGVSDGINQGLALLADGTVVGFGIAFGGGDASTEVRLLGLTNATAVSEGNNFAMALKKDGSVVVWGNNSLTNVPTNAMSGVASISAGWNYAVALKSDGSVVAWGNVPANLSTNSMQATAVEAGFSSLLIGRQNVSGRALDDCQTSGGLQNNPFINNGGNNGVRVLPVPRSIPPGRLMPGQTTAAPQPGAVVLPPGRVPPPPR